MMPLKAPFPYFGGKSRVASLVWERFGTVRNYVEPFFGSGAVLLGRPLPFDGVETVNDADGLLANFWRALQADPDAVAHHADWPVNELDYFAFRKWVHEQEPELTERLRQDHTHYRADVAGRYAWVLSCAIGNNGYSKTRRDRPHLGDAGRGVNRQHGGLVEYMRALADRLRHVRVCCGDWSRVCGDSVTITHGAAAVFLDPPYADTAKRNPNLYRVDCLSVAHAVREWAVSKGDDPRYRIALCGYEGEHVMPESWECVAWKAHGGMASHSKRHDNPNAKRERIWFSPHCVKPQRTNLSVLPDSSPAPDLGAQVSEQQGLLF